MLAACLAALAPAASVSPAVASVTIGQIAPANPPTTCGGATTDLVQPTVTSGNTYVVPATIATGTITSWSTSAAAGAGQIFTMKVFRRVSGSTYMAVGHDGPRALTGGTVNTFPANVPVKPGDVLGINRALGSSNCVFSAPGETALQLPFMDLADGASGTFSAVSNFRVNVSASVAPTNTFTLGKPKLNKKKGTATLTADVPNPGTLSASGKGVKAASAGGAVISKTVGVPGKVKLQIKPKGKTKKKLKKNGKAKVKLKVTYTPTSGEAASQTRKLKLKRKKR